MEDIIEVPRSFEIPNQSFGEFILDELRKAPMKIIQIDAKSGETLTNRDLLKQSITLAKEFAKRNMKVGVTAMISSENSINYTAAVWATLFTGACVSPINPAYTEGELRHCINISKPKFIFVSKKTEKLVNQVIKSLPWQIELIQLDNETNLNGVDTVRNIIKNSIKFLINNDIKNYKAASIPRLAEQEVVILFSSGTTGLPKGVMLSSRNWMTMYFTRAFVFNKPLENNIFLLLLPFFHGYGFLMMMWAATMGALGIIMSSFEPKLFCQTIERYKVNVLTVAPPLMVFLAKHPLVSDYNLSCVREIISGGAPLPVDIYAAVKNRFGNQIDIRNGYGMTELTVVSTIAPHKTENAKTIGRLLPGFSCKVIDPESLKTLGKNKSGELCFKGDLVMLGYRDNPEATSEIIDQDGWLHTGDLGYYNDDGYFFIDGRLKELIKYKGFQIAPVELETLLLSHPEVDDAAVFGLDHVECGQIPVGIVVLKTNSKITPQQLCQFVNDRVSPQKYLRGGVKIVKSIPKTPSGKILRRELHKLNSKL